MREPKIYPEYPALRLTAKFISDSAYPEVLDGLNRTCVDIVPISRSCNKIFLAKRAIKPMQGWWWIGGGMRRGETYREAAVRNFKRETSLDISQDRLEFVIENRYWWKDREQEPQENGCDMTAYTYAIQLTDEEITIASKNLDKKEYEPGVGLQGFDRSQLTEIGVHEAILDFYDEVFSASRAARPYRMLE